MINIAMMETITLLVTGMVELVVPIMLTIGISFVQIVNALTLTEKLPLLAKTSGRQKNVKNKRRRGNAARKRLLRSAKKPAESVKTFHIVFTHELVCVQIHDNNVFAIKSSFVLFFA